MELLKFRYIYRQAKSILLVIAVLKQLFRFD